MIELDEETQLLLAAYLRTQPLPVVRGGGTVRLEFQLHPAGGPPTIEPLLHYPEGRAWLVRMPNGTRRWMTEAFLRGRRLPVPTPPPIIATVGADGTEFYWTPPVGETLSLVEQE